jgi:HK97 family phage major capsid protein
MKLRELYAQKKAAYGAWKQVMDAADAENRELTAEETAIADQANAAIDSANEQIQAEQNKDAMRAKLAGLADEIRDMEKAPAGRLEQFKQTTPAPKKSMIERLHDHMEAGVSRREAVAMIAKERDEAASKAFKSYLLGSHAALQKDSDAAGGFLLAPEQFIAQLIKDLDEMVWFRNFATVIPVVGAQGIGVPSLATDIADTVWTSELAVGTEDTSMAFGKRALTPHPLAKYIKVSKDLLRSAALSVESIVRERLAYKFGTVQETAFMTGSGANQPLGVFTASAMGISTSRDVSTDNTNTAITADGLINAKYGLGNPWLNSGNLRWVFHKDAVKMIRKLKDGEGQYLLQPGLREDSTDMLLGVPVLVSAYAPNTFTTGLYVGLIGDLSNYWIAENMGLEIQRLVELGALTNQDYFIGRMALDGMPILEEAFIRVTLA